MESLRQTNANRRKSSVKRSAASCLLLLSLILPTQQSAYAQGMSLTDLIDTLRTVCVAAATACDAKNISGSSNRCMELVPILAEALISDSVRVHLRFRNNDASPRANCMNCFLVDAIGQTYKRVTRRTRDILHAAGEGYDPPEKRYKRCPFR